MDNKNQFQIGRRNAIKRIGLSAMVMTSAPFVLTPSRAAPKKITLLDQGGVISQAYKDLLYKPFTQKTGIEVIGVPLAPDSTTEIRTVVETKRYIYDMAIIGRSISAFLTADSIYLERHELDDDPIISSIPSQYRSPYSVGTHVSTTVLAYHTGAFKGRRAPKSWQDLWDVSHIPGRRGLRKHPFNTIEIALMADGVPLNNVYPCDLDRAFRSLEKIKPYIAVWWTGGPQTEQQLKSEEVDLTSVWLIRAQAAIDVGAPFAISWDQHLYNCMGWAILKGAPNADACRQFIKFASDPKRQAVLAPYLIGPTQPDAFNYIEPKYAKSLPTYPANLKNGLYVDGAYWAKHQNTALERFNDWILT